MPAVQLARIARALTVLLLLVTFVSRAGAACSGFGAGAAFAAGTSPQAVVTADFDADGVPDLALACLTGAPLQVLRGTGSGAFAAPVAYASGASGRALAASDFNADGRIDLAVGVGAGVAIWLGDGRGAFAGGSISPAGSAIRGVACADFDADGIVDLALSSSGTNSLLVLRGLGASGAGNGAFGAPSAYAVGGSPARLLATDLDGDGITDLAVANNGGASVSVLRGRGAQGRGDGTFDAARTVAATGSPWGLAALDWDRDGRTDLLASDGAGTTLSLLRGAGACAFAGAGTIAVATAPRDLVAGDFDGDGIADAAAACAAANVVAVVRGTGSGFVPLGSFAAGSGATGLAGGDWNADGIADLASANAGAGSVTRWLGTCAAPPSATVTLLAPLGHETWWPGTVQQVLWTRGAGVTTVDVDLSRDGGASWSPLARGALGDRTDVPTTRTPATGLRARVRDALVASRVSASPADFTLCALFDAPLASVAPLAATRLAAGDLDADGALDLAIADPARVAVLHGDGTGRFEPGLALADAGTLRLRLADADADGALDLLRVTAAGVALRRGDGAGGFAPESLLVLPGAMRALVLDTDSDGTGDVVALAAAGAGARLAVWRSGTPGVPWSLDIEGAPGALASADFDGDGLADLALGAGSAVRVLYANGAAAKGDGTFRAGPARSLPSPAGELAVGDIDRDGTPDLLATLPASGDLAWLPVTPPAGPLAAGALGPPRVVATGELPLAPHLADLDGDGRLDAIVALSGSGTLAVLRGAANGFAPAAPFASGACAGPFAIGDFTGDGNPDAAIATIDASVHTLPAQCPPQIPAAIALAASADTGAAVVGFSRTWRWSRSASVAAVRVELSRDDGAHWTVLAEAVSADSLAWVTSGATSPAARVRVSDAACATRSTTGARFAIRPAFGDASASPALPAATAFACGEIDGDATPDVALADAAGVEWFAGDIDGGFAPRERWSVPGVRRVRVSDLDADGRADLLTIHANAFTVRLGAGDGAFAPARSYAIEAGAVDFEVEDFDEDGVPDVAIACGEGPIHRVAVRRGLGRQPDGAPGLGDPRYVPIGGRPTALAAADADVDGVLDLLVAHAGGLAVLRGGGSAGRGDGTFRVASQRSFGAGGVHALLVADVDADGLPDAIATDTTAGALLVSRGDGACGFGAAIGPALPSAPQAVQALDLDRDSVLDLTATLADGNLALLRGVAGAPLARRFVLAALVPAAAGPLVLRDADIDGVADAIVPDRAGVLRVLRLVGEAAPAPRLVAPTGGSVGVGSEVALAWTRPAGVAAVDVQLSRDGGGRWVTLARAIPGTTWRWTASGPFTGVARLRVRDAAVPTHADAAGVAFTIDPTVTGVGPDSPSRASLGAPWPNPARGGIALTLRLPAPASVRVEACDAAGRRVRTLADEHFVAGDHELRWDGTDARGTRVAPGVYFVTARAPGFAATRRVIRR